MSSVSIGISWYSVIHAWRSGEMPIEKFCDFARECGADGIEYLDAFMYAPGIVRDHLLPPSEIMGMRESLSKALTRSKLRLHAFAVTNDFTNRSPERIAIEEGKIQIGLEVCEALGQGHLRVFSGNPSTPEDSQFTHSQTIQSLSNFANSGRLALENHGNVFCTTQRILPILDSVPNLGFCFDIGNFILADVNPAEVATQLPFPKLIHVKYFKEDPEGPYTSPSGKRFAGCRLGEGVVPIEETLQLLFNRQDRSPVAIDLEMECGADGIEASRQGVLWLRQRLDQWLS